MSALQKLAFLSLLLYLFLLHTRILDLTLPNLHIPTMSLYAALGAAFVGGGMIRVFTHRITHGFLAMCAWMILAVPFSFWPGGAATNVQLWLKTLLVYVVIVGLITTFDQTRRAIHLLAYSILFLAVLAVFFGDMSTGRLMFDRGRFTNPNDLAQILLMGLPFWWYVATNPTLKRSKRVAAYLAFIPILATMSRTGSRGAMIATLAVVLVLFWRSSMSHKVLIIFGATVVVLLASVFLPDSLKERYFTYFSPEGGADPQTQQEEFMQDSAITSAWGRWELFKDSLRLTARHPLFGVGAGLFDVAQDKLSWELRHHKGAWQVTHNTFTEVSSENGIPAFIFYVMVVVWCFRAATLPRSVRARPGPRIAELKAASFCLRLSMLSFVVSGLFASFAYQTQLPVLAALAVAFSRTAKAELAKDEAAQAAQTATAPPEPRRVLPGRAAASTGRKDQGRLPLAGPLRPAPNPGT